MRMPQMSGYQLGMLQQFHEAGHKGISEEKAAELNQTTLNSAFRKSRLWADQNRRTGAYVINKNGEEALRQMLTANILRKDPFRPMGKFVPRRRGRNGASSE